MNGTRAAKTCPLTRYVHGYLAQVANFDCLPRNFYENVANLDASPRCRLSCVRKQVTNTSTRHDANNPVNVAMPHYPLARVVYAALCMPLYACRSMYAAL